MIETETKDFIVVPGMKEDGLHGVDGFYVALEGDVPENDDDFHTDREDAERICRELNSEDPMNPTDTHRSIAEAVGSGWPAWEVTPGEVAAILKAYRRSEQNTAVVARRTGFNVSVIEAVLASAHTHGVIE